MTPVGWNEVADGNKDDNSDATESSYGRIAAARLSRRHWREKTTRHGRKDGRTNTQPSTDRPVDRWAEEGLMLGREGTKPMIMRHLHMVHKCMYSLHRLCTHLRTYYMHWDCVIRANVYACTAYDMHIYFIRNTNLAASIFMDIRWVTHRLQINGSQMGICRAAIYIN